MSQMSLFSAAAREPRVADLDGLLAGPGQVVRRGATARISVVVDDEWRAEALAAEMQAVGIAAERDDAEQGGTAVRTPWLAELRPVADAWTAGAVKRPPAHWSLDGARLRCWCIAAGSGQPGLYSLALGVSDEPAWQPIGAALAASGVPGVLVGPRADGPAYRVVGQRRLARLRELVGDPPDGAPDGAWPTLIYR
ncbi:MAG: hypothetical protein JO079_09505 [Frankiaceae bacterium]|nr:hypothetical protein [Frankiaceae bacterium]MBV9368246.1 hypothetical protein [Frankiales bacterium]